MARQQDYKRARVQTNSPNQNEDENENDQETHPSKKKVRWDSGARDSGVDDQANSDDEPGGPQKVRCLKSIINYRFHLYCVP
jgi:hypothetical protein